MPVMERLHDASRPDSFSLSSLSVPRMASVVVVVVRWALYRIYKWLMGK